MLGLTQRLVGQEALDYAASVKCSLNIYGHHYHTLVEDANGTFYRTSIWAEPAIGVSLEEALEVACEDPSLVWIDVRKAASA